MKNSIATLAVFASAFALSACGANNDASETTATEAAIETSTTETCNQETMVAKATELGEKMTALASNPTEMQELASKMQEVQEKMQKGAADGSFSVEDACAAYDELLATS